MRKRAFSAIISIGWVFVGPSVLAQDTHESEDEEVYESWWTPQLITDSCENLTPKIGPGSSRETAIKIDFSEVHQEHEDFEEYLKLDCRWVRFEALLRWDRYYDYVASLYGGLDSYYGFARDSFDKRSQTIWVESFAEGLEPPPTKQQSLVEVSGLYYDLCVHNELMVRSEPNYNEGEIIWHFGPCHYSSVSLIKQVSVDHWLSSPFHYLNLSNSEEDQRNLERYIGEENDKIQILEAANRWISLVKEGGHIKYLQALNLRREDMKEALTSPGAFEKVFLLGESFQALQLSKIRGNMEHIIVNEYWVDNDGTIERYDENVAVCYCYDGSCEDKWPIISFDTDRPSHPFLCLWLEKRKRDDGEIEWSWSNEG